MKRITHTLAKQKDNYEYNYEMHLANLTEEYVWTFCNGLVINDTTV